MTTSKTAMTTTRLSNPTGDNRVPLGTLGYFQARNKRRAYSLVMKEFRKSGLSQADLARRLGKGPDVVCRLLGGPGNWTLDTVSDLLFAISGAAPTLGVEYPLNNSQRNQVGPDWLYDDVVVRVPPKKQTADVASKVVRIDFAVGITVTAGAS
jgi:hypothetical protein